MSALAAKPVPEALYVCHDAQSIRHVLGLGMRRPIAVIVDAANAKAPGAVRQIQEELLRAVIAAAPKTKAAKPRRRLAPGSRSA